MQKLAYRDALKQALTDAMREDDVRPNVGRNNVLGFVGDDCLCVFHCAILIE